MCNQRVFAYIFSYFIHPWLKGMILGLLVAASGACFGLNYGANVVNYGGGGLLGGNDDTASIDVHDKYLYVHNYMVNIVFWFLLYLYH